MVKGAKAKLPTSFGSGDNHHSLLRDVALKVELNVGNYDPTKSVFRGLQIEETDLFSYATGNDTITSNVITGVSDEPTITTIEETLPEDGVIPSQDTPIVPSAFINSKPIFFARCLIEVKADEVLKYSITIGIPLPKGSGVFWKWFELSMSENHLGVNLVMYMINALNATDIPIVDMNDDGFQMVVNKRKSGKTGSTSTNRSGVTVGNATWQPIKSNVIFEPKAHGNSPKNRAPNVFISAKDGLNIVLTSSSNIPISNPYDLLSQEFDLGNYPMSEVICMFWMRSPRNNLFSLGFILRVGSGSVYMSPPSYLSSVGLASDGGFLKIVTRSGFADEYLSNFPLLVKKGFHCQVRKIPMLKKFALLAGTQIRQFLEFMLHTAFISSKGRCHNQGEEFGDRGGNAASILTSGVQVVSVLPAAEVVTVGISTGSCLVPTTCLIFTASVVTPYSRCKGNEKMVESDTPKKKKLQEQIDFLKSHSGWKTKHFKGMSLKEIREKFILVWKHIEDFIPMASKEEGERVKRKGLKLEHESAKKMKTSEEVSEEDLKEIMQLVPVEEATSDKEKELWVELKKLYEPDVEDQLWTHTQALMHDPVEGDYTTHVVFIIEERFPLLSQKDAPAEEVCTAVSSDERIKAVRKMIFVSKGNNAKEFDVLCAIVPIMLRSGYCTLFQNSDKDLRELGECPYDQEKTLAEIEKLHLSIINSSANFANSTLYIIVITQVCDVKTFITHMFLTSGGPMAGQTYSCCRCRAIIRSGPCRRRE
nr:RNA polymerase II second largest subunit [Tanacetum cinerariifolium]